MSKPFIALMVILLFLLCIIGVAGLYQPISGLTGAAHPTFEGMKVSPDNTDMHVHTQWLGYLFALGLIAMFTVILIIGSMRNGQFTGLYKGLIVFGLVYACIFSLMILSNWSYVGSDSNTFFWQMPRPTAWMIYLVWLSPLMVTALYVFNFERWIISPEDEADLKEFLNQNS